MTNPDNPPPGGRAVTMTGDRCRDCAFWHKGYTLHASRVPSFCTRHFHSQSGDDKACKDFNDREECENGEQK